MRQKLRLLSIVAFFAILLVGTSITSPLFAAEFNWKIQSTWGRGDLTMETLEYFTQRVSERSNGRIKIEVFAEPEILPLPEVLPACSKGAIQMAQGGGAIWSMVIPSGDVLFGSLPRIWAFPDKTVTEGAKMQRKWLFETGAVDIIRKEFAKHNLYWLDMHGAGSVCSLSTKKVSTIKDLKGLKLADLGGWMSQWHSAIGWVPVEMLPASEMEMALRLGTIDGLVWDLSAITGFGWNKEAPYWISNLGVTTHVLGDILINMDEWNSLPDDLKKSVAGAAEDYFHKCNEKYEELMAQVKNKVKSGEIVESPLDDEFMRVSNQEAYKLWDKASKEDPVSAELIKSIKAFRGIK